jgi:hypothetical protein
MAEIDAGLAFDRQNHNRSRADLSGVTDRYALAHSECYRLQR